MVQDREDRREVMNDVTNGARCVTDSFLFYNI